MILLISGVVFANLNLPSPHLFSLPIIYLEKSFWPLYLAFAFFIFAITLYEIFFLRILNIFTFSGMAVALIFAIFLKEVSFLTHLLGLFAGSLPLIIIALVYFKMTGNDGIGMGVIKLAGMIGAFIGPYKVIIALILSFLIIMPYFYMQYKRDKVFTIEFGPVLSIASLTTVIIPYEKLLIGILNHIKLLA